MTDVPLADPPPAEVSLAEARAQRAVEASHPGALRPAAPERLVSANSSPAEARAQRAVETLSPTAPLAEDRRASAAFEAPRPTETVDVVVIGGGPAGLSAALNLGRARARVLVVDANRPRNAATLNSHGFLTRDGIPPHELRKLARAELDAYPDVEVVERATVSRVMPVGAEPAWVAELPDGARFLVDIDGRGPGFPRRVAAHSVLVTTGLRETLPSIPSIRGYYGMSLFSCVACDGWEQRDLPIALIGETPDLYARALLVARWSADLTVFTNGAEVIDGAEESSLAARGIRVERRPIDDLEGDRGALTAVRLGDGERVTVRGGFVRPLWHPVLDFLADLPRATDVDGHFPASLVTGPGGGFAAASGALVTDADGHLVTDGSGRAGIPGLYAAGDVASPGPQQLIVAAGAGARVAAILTHDQLGITTAH